jgi:hypothetical protein
MSDPKQPIYNALNWMSGAMSVEKPDDSILIMNAYEKVYTLPDQETQRLFLDVIQRLRFRDSTIHNVIGAWERASEQLISACQMIDEKK